MPVDDADGITHVLVVPSKRSDSSRRSESGSDHASVSGRSAKRGRAPSTFSEILSQLGPSPETTIRSVYVNIKNSVIGSGIAIQAEVRQGDVFGECLDRMIHGKHLDTEHKVAERCIRRGFQEADFELGVKDKRSERSGPWELMCRRYLANAIQRALSNYETTERFERLEASIRESHGMLKESVKESIKESHGMVKEFVKASHGMTETSAVTRDLRWHHRSHRQATVTRPCAVPSRWFRPQLNV